MLAAVAALGVAGIAANRSERPISRLPSPAFPLWKPQPSDLLSQEGLGLSHRQVAAIREIATAWEKEKSSLESEIDGYLPRQGRLDQITGSLQNYSDLSRAFDATRALHWEKALNQLTQAQRSQVRRNRP